MGKREKWYYNGNLVNVVNSYTYLGFTFTVKVSYKEGLVLLLLLLLFCSEDRKAVFHQCKTLMMLKNMTRQTFLHQDPTSADVCVRDLGNRKTW